MLLTDDLLFDYQRCDRLSFLNVYGDWRDRDRPSDFVLKLKQDSQHYRNSVLAHTDYETPRYSSGDWVAGAKATLELMRQGAERIYQGVLYAEDSQGVTLLSRPHLLIKQPGPSAFGEWHYSVMEIRFSKRPKAEHQVMVAFHTYVLAQVQEVWPHQGWVVTREKGFSAVNLAKYGRLMRGIMGQCLEMLEKRQEPEVFIARHPCGLCEWYSSCYAIAESNHHLSLLPGVTPTRYRQLQQLDVTTVEALADADPEKLAIALEAACNNQYAPEVVATQLILQAQATLGDRAIPKPGQVPIAPHLLPVSPIELYFDIEAEPELDVDFLFGVLAIDRRNLCNGTEPRQTFYPFFAETPAEEERIWNEFLSLIWSYPIAPIFHFCDYEFQTLKKLAKRYRTPAQRWRPILKRFVDIHKLATRSAIAPVENYALKSLARWLGFDWRESLASGAQCVLWYDRWLETGDRRYLEAILSYNEDDCRATYVVKDWLVNFSQTYSQPH
jgi:uncharacterized protein